MQDNPTLNFGEGVLLGHRKTCTKGSTTKKGAGPCDVLRMRNRIRMNIEYSYRVYDIVIAGMQGFYVIRVGRICFTRTVHLTLVKMNPMA